MPTQNQLDRSVCSICGHKFVEDEPLCAVNGNTCMPCYENKDITVNIGGHEIPQQLLSEYAAAVEAVRRGTVIADSRTDPLILVQKERNRVDAHTRILEAAGIKYRDQYLDNTFQTGLAKWLDANTSDIPEAGMT